MMSGRIYWDDASDLQGWAWEARTDETQESGPIESYDRDATDAELIALAPREFSIALGPQSVAWEVAR